MSTEEKFYAAVQVIKSLPKNGSYSPSNEMMLKFYSFYKQATEGPCSASRPSFWEPVKKAKWDAWNALGDMPKETAMDNYVNELKKIIETMSFTEPVAQFMDVLGPFYEVVDINNPAVIKKNSQITNGDVQHHDNLDNGIDNHLNSNEGSASDESESDEYSDTFDQIADSGYVEPSCVPGVTDIDGSTENIYIKKFSVFDSSVAVKRRECYHSDSEEGSAVPSSSGEDRLKSAMSTNGDMSSPSKSTQGSSPNMDLANILSGQHISNTDLVRTNPGDSNNINVQLTMAVIKLQKDLDDITKRMQSFENKICTKNHHNHNLVSSTWLFPKCWSLKTVAFVCLWPFVVRFIFAFLRKRLRIQRP